MRLFKSTFLGGLLATASLTIAEPQYKIHLDPSMAVFGYANLQLDRKVAEDLSLGLMFWHQDRESWAGNGDSESSAGVRIDWFEQGVFESGWHSNAMVKSDFTNFELSRLRLKLTQTYQLVRNDVYINLGIGVQFVDDQLEGDDDPYSDYRSFMLPSWEFSVGRAF